MADHICASVSINRSPEDVFAYMSDLSRHGEWQEMIQKVEVLTDGPTRVGTQAKDLRKPPFGPAVWATYEITELDPPRLATFRGIDGPIRVIGTVTVAPEGEGSRVSLEFDAEPHGLMGKLMMPMVRKQMRTQVPADQQRLKERLESGAAQGST
jgi:uncharacterized membrane protein